MAGRGGTGVGAVVTITIMGVLVLGLFVATLVFYTESNKTQAQLAEANQAMSDYVREGERQQDRVRTYLSEAQQSGNRSLVTYLIESLEAANAASVGLPRVTTAAFNQRRSEVPGLEATSMLAAIQNRDQQISALRRQVQAAEDARTQAQRDLTTARASVARIQSDFNATMQAANERIGTYGTDVRSYQDGLRAIEQRTLEQITILQNEYSIQMAKLNDDLARLREENLIQREQLRVLNQARPSVGLVPDPATLVDGRIAAVNPAEREVIIDIGRQHKVVLGLTFTVFGSASQIRQDATGAYTQGKATIEVIRIDSTTATCRVITETRGNPIVRGDVIVNAVYDPNKTFRFVVYGNFDTNRDGTSTPGERDDLAVLIREWGGQVVDDLAGDVDFVVLGTRPIVPPPPPAGADIAVMSEWQRLDRMARRYDDLFNRARDSSIPVLNQNRLFYLIGM